MEFIYKIKKIDRAQLIPAAVFLGAIVFLGLFSIIGSLTIKARPEESPVAQSEPLALPSDTTSPSDIVCSEIIDSVEDNTMNNFYEKEIDDEIFNRINGKSYKADCTTLISDLSYLHVLYIDFNGQTKEGELICNRAIASDLLDIFEKLYQAKYPIERIELVDNYDADDEKSMSANNSSCFNFRFISYTTTVSNHGLGMAVDINPLYNPYVKTVGDRLSIEPANAEDYVDRDKDFPHKIDENDLCYKLFIEHGFSWGGSWTHSKDYQHFEKEL